MYNSPTAVLVVGGFGLRPDAAGLFNIIGIMCNRGIFGPNPRVRGGPHPKVCFASCSLLRVAVGPPTLRAPLQVGAPSPTHSGYTLPALSGCLVGGGLPLWGPTTCPQRKITTSPAAYVPVQGAPLQYVSPLARFCALYVGPPTLRASAAGWGPFPHPQRQTLPALSGCGHGGGCSRGCCAGWASFLVGGGPTRHSRPSC